MKQLYSGKGKSNRPVFRLNAGILLDTQIKTLDEGEADRYFNIETGLKVRNGIKKYVYILKGAS